MFTEKFLSKTYRKAAQAFPFVRAIEGSLIAERALRYDYLFDEIRKNKCRRIMEVGVWNGERAFEMINTAKRHHSPRDIEYYGFDIFEMMDDEIYEKEVSKRPPSMDEVRGKIEKTGARITLFKGFSEEIMPQVMPDLGEVDFAFIDGGHSIETITNDWAYTQQVMGEKTIVIFDDYWGGEWGGRKDAGCQSLIDGLDRTRFKVKILPLKDKFKKDWGVMEINFARVKRA